MFTFFWVHFVHLFGPRKVVFTKGIGGTQSSGLIPVPTSQGGHWLAPS